MKPKVTIGTYGPTGVETPEILINTGEYRDYSVHDCLGKRIRPSWGKDYWCNRWGHKNGKYKNLKKRRLLLFVDKSSVMNVHRVWRVNDCRWIYKFQVRRPDRWPLWFSLLRLWLRRTLFILVSDIPFVWTVWIFFKSSRCNAKTSRVWKRKHTDGGDYFIYVKVILYTIFTIEYWRN